MKQEHGQRLRAWAWERLGLHRPERDTREALSDLIAVYSSQPTAPLSLASRMSELTGHSFRELERDRHAIRIPAMRESIFLVPTQTAPEIFAATRVPLEKHAGRLKFAELSWDDYDWIKKQVSTIAREPMTPAELQVAIPVSGNLMVAVKTLAREGLVLRVASSLRGDSLRYVATDAWLGEPLPERDPEESLHWLAGEYLRLFGPVRPEDFAWWTGVTKTRARNAFAGLGTVALEDGQLLRAVDRQAFEAIPELTGDEIAVIPKWDPYTMGYPMDNRGRFIDDAHLSKAYAKVSATSGDGLPLVLRGGKAVATWAHRFKGDRMDITVSPFDQSDRLDWLSEEAFEPVATALDASDVNLAIDNT